MSSNATLDRFWDEFSEVEPTAELGGIDANKPGYHEKRDDLPADDYSVAHVAADRRGAGDVAAGIDLTMHPAGGAKMQHYTRRLKTAALARDERLYLRGGPTLREFIGSDDGQRVYCYVFTGGVPLGVGADSGPDWDRSSTHLWHIHLSIIRQYAEDWPALDGVLSVLKGESLAAWRARTEGDGMATETETQVAWIDARVEAVGKGLDKVADGRPGAGQDVWLVKTLRALLAGLATLAADVAELKARPEPGTVVVTDEQLERVLRKVIGSVDGVSPQG